MTFESEDNFKKWLKINGYDKSDIEILSSTWDIAHISDGILVINNSSNNQIEVIDNSVEITQ